MTPELDLKDTAFSFTKHGHTLASAIAYAELGKVMKNDASIWTGLGASLARGAGTFNRERFLKEGAASLMRGLEIGQGTPFASPCRNWLEVISEEVDLSEVGPIKDDALEPLIVFLDIVPEAFADAVRAVPEDEQGRAIRALGDSGNPRFLGALLAAVRGEFGDMRTREALKRLGKFGDRPEIREALAALATDARASDFQPYLGAALQAVNPEWAAQFGEI